MPIITSAMRTRLTHEASLRSCGAVLGSEVMLPALIEERDESTRPADGARRDTDARCDIAAGKRA
jgi:hypothetical protein